MFYWTVHLKGIPISNTFGHDAVSVGDKVYCFGGYYYNDKDQIDVHVFNTVSLRWVKLPRREDDNIEVPSMRRNHTAVLIDITTYIWGGYKYYTGDHCNVLYAFDVDTHRWFRPGVSGTLPEGRYHHSACVLGKVMYIHGGRSLRTGHTNDVCKLDTTTMVWTLIDVGGTLPPVSMSHSATIIGTKMFVFGGWEGWGYNNIRVFDTEINHWLSTPSAQLLPEGHGDHSAFAYDGELYIFGGDQGLNDLWKFNPETFSWKKVQPKGEGPPGTTTMCCCMVGCRVVLFGGDNLYILDLSPSLMMLCKLAVIQHGLEQSELPNGIRWELAAMTTSRNRSKRSH